MKKDLDSKQNHDKIMQTWRKNKVQKNKHYILEHLTEIKLRIKYTKHEGAICGHVACWIDDTAYIENEGRSNIDK